MDTALERIQAKIAELETKIVNLRIAERELVALDKISAQPARTVRRQSQNRSQGQNQPFGRSSRASRRQAAAARRARPPARRSSKSSTGMAPFRPPRSPSTSGPQAETSTIELYLSRFKR